MIFSTLLLLAINSNIVISGQLQCRDQSGRAVDWYIVYKLPQLIGEGQPFDSGYRYAYITSDTKNGFQYCDIEIDNKNSILGQTLEPLYANRLSYDVSYIEYNDQPSGVEDKHHWMSAHAKGIVAVDYNYGFWLIHSIPGFSSNENTGAFEYPKSGVKYGQTALCISMRTEEMSKVVHQILVMAPEIFSMKLSDSFKTSIYGAHNLEDRNWSQDRVGIRILSSTDGTKFTAFSKNLEHEVDIYSKMVAPELDVDMYVQTWRQNPGYPLDSFCEIPFVENIYEMSPKFQNWGPTGKFTYWDDQSKWAISANSLKPYVCIGDTDRMLSQNKRGGGTICFENQQVWDSLSEWVSVVETCGQSDYPTDHRIQNTTNIRNDNIPVDNSAPTGNLVTNVNRYINDENVETYPVYNPPVIATPTRVIYGQGSLNPADISSGRPLDPTKAVIPASSISSIPATSIPASIIPALNIPTSSIPVSSISDSYLPPSSYLTPALSRPTSPLPSSSIPDSIIPSYYIPTLSKPNSFISNPPIPSSIPPPSIPSLSNRDSPVPSYSIPTYLPATPVSNNSSPSAIITNFSISSAPIPVSSNLTPLIPSTISPLVLSSKPLSLTPIYPDINPQISYPRVLHPRTFNSQWFETRFNAALRPSSSIQAPYSPASSNTVTSTPPGLISNFSIYSTSIPNSPIITAPPPISVSSAALSVPAFVTTVPIIKTTTSAPVIPTALAQSSSLPAFSTTNPLITTAPNSTISISSSIPNLLITTPSTSIYPIPASFNNSAFITVSSTPSPVIPIFRPKVPHFPNFRFLNPHPFNSRFMHNRFKSATKSSYFIPDSSKPPNSIPNSVSSTASPSIVSISTSASVITESSTNSVFIPVFPPIVSPNPFITNSNSTILSNLSTGSLINPVPTIAPVIPVSSSILVPLITASTTPFPSILASSTNIVPTPGLSTLAPSPVNSTLASSTPSTTSINSSLADVASERKSNTQTIFMKTFKPDWDTQTTTAKFKPSWD